MPKVYKINDNYSLSMNKPKHLLFFTLLLFLSSCASINCTLDSVVVWTLTFYDSETEEPLKLPVNLTVEAEGAGTLYNQGHGITSMALPMSIASPTDTLFLRWKSGSFESTDILFLDHTNTPHFDAIDCPAAVFHDISGFRFEASSAEVQPVTIDSITIIRSIVDYQDVENIRLYLHTNTLPDVDDSDTDDGQGSADGGDTDDGQ